MADWKTSARQIVENTKTISPVTQNPNTGVNNNSGVWKDSARNIVNNVKNSTYSLITNDGRNFGLVSGDAYMAITSGKLDYYVPKTDEEKKVIDSYKKYIEEQYKLINTPEADKTNTIISDYVPGAYSMTKSEYERRRASNPQLPAFGSYEYFKSREESLRPIMDEIANDVERADDAKVTWSQNYQNEPATPENKAEGERLANKFKYQDAIIAEYKAIDEQLKKFETYGVHYDKDGNIDTKSGSAEAKYASERYETIASATGLSMIESALGFKGELSPEKQEKYDQGKKASDLSKVEFVKEKAYNEYEKSKDNVYNNNLGGIIAGNFKIGDINIQKNNANYASFNATVGDLEAADVYNALSERIQKNNSATFQNNTKGKELLSVLSQYIPQARDQLTYEALGRAVGLATGTYGVGNLTGSAGSAAYMYRQTAGASFERLLRESDLSVEDAKKLASSEALASGTVEFGLSAATGLLWKTSNFATKGAIKKVVSESAENVTKRAVSGLMAIGISEKGAKIIAKTAITAGKIAIDGAGEGLEEWIQEGMSIKADKYAKEGKVPSAFELLVNTFDLSEYSSDDFKRMKQSFLAGTIIGFGHGGFNAALSTSVDATMKKISNAVDSTVLGKEIIKSGSAEMVAEAIDTIKETASSTEAKAIERIETAISDGKQPSAIDVGTVVKSALTKSMSVGDVFQDTKSGNTVTVVDRDAETTTVQVNTSKGVTTQKMPNSKADSFVTSGQLAKIESPAEMDIAKNATTTTETDAPETIKTINLTRRGNSYEAYGEAATILANALDSETTKTFINGVETDVLSVPADMAEDFADAVSDEYDIVLSDKPRAKTQPVARETAVADETTPIVEENSAENKIWTTVGAMNDTFAPGAIEKINNSDLKGDVVKLAELVSDFYNQNGTLSFFADYFTDGGAQVISAIEGKTDTVDVADTVTDTVTEESSVVADTSNDIISVLGETLTPEAKADLGNGDVDANYNSIIKMFEEVYNADGTLEAFANFFTDGGKKVEATLQRNIGNAVGDKNATTEKTESSETKVLKNESESDTIESTTENDSVEGKDDSDERRSDTLSRNSRRGNNGSTRKQTERISYFERKNKGRDATERQNLTRELVERGHTEEVIDGHYKYTIIKPEAYNDDMLSMAEEAKSKGVELQFIVGKVKVNFDTKDEFTVRGLKLSSTRVVVQYDNVKSPQKIAKHEIIHAKWNTPEIQAIKDTIINSLSAEEKQSILSQERYSRYNEVYNDENVVLEEFVCDVMSGANEYYERFADTVTDYWYGNEELDSYNVAEYSESIDAGGKEASEGRFDLSDEGGEHDGKINNSRRINGISEVSRNSGRRNTSDKRMLSTSSAEREGENGDSARHTEGRRTQRSSKTRMENNSYSGKSAFRTERKETKGRRFLEAIKSGDVDTARVLLDEKATDGGYTPSKVYHGTKAETAFVRFKSEKPIWITPDIDYASAYSGEITDDTSSLYTEPNSKVYELYAKYGNTLELGDIEQEILSYDDVVNFAKKIGFTVNEVLACRSQGRIYETDAIWSITQTPKFADLAREKGYDSLHALEDGGKVETYGILYPENVKSAKLETFDDDGNVIPLSERFNTDNKDIRYDLDEDSNDDFSRIQEKQLEIQQLTNQIRELEKSDELGKMMDEFSKAVADDNADKGMEIYNKWLVDTGYDKLREQRDKLQEEVDGWNKAWKESYEAKKLEAENKAIEKSGLSEADYFRKQAVKEFGYTPYFYDAGYITPNGKMLNFSGEKGRHFGSRGQDHRAIGIVYANVDGSKAMLKFMGEGNVRIMAESPGIDISSSVEPSKEQYATIRKFVREYASKEYFNIDITDAEGHTVGNYEYEGRVSAERVVNDIKYFFENGTTREASSIAQFRYDLDDTDTEGNTLTKEQQEYFKDSKVRDENGKLLVMYQGSANDFTVFDRKKSSYANLYGRGFYFTKSEEHASRYGNTKAYYLNIKKPVSTTETTITKAQLRKFLEAVTENEDYSFENYGYDATVDSVLKSTYNKSDFLMLNDVSQTAIGDLVETIELFNEINGTDYDGIILDTETITFNSEQAKLISNKNPTSNPDVRYDLDEERYAPTFYSQMGKVIDEMKQDKVGANSVIPYLKGKGVKNEELKWSGIETFLEGKKSVTKAELQEFIAGSQLQIEETVLEGGEEITLQSMLETRYGASKDLYVLHGDEILDALMWNYEDNVWESDELGYTFSSEESIRNYYGVNESGTRWDKYKLDGGENYREIIFKMPESTYSNGAMRGHWGDNAMGVLAHARIQDFDVDGKKMLFVEEIQSDWHNEGAKKGYAKSNDADIRAKRHELENYIKSRLGKDNSAEEMAKIQEARAEYIRLGQNMSNADAIPDAPFRDNYHEYVLKHLIRMAAEQGYDSIGWTPADVQSKRWSDEYAEGYRIEYDQDIPKFLNKYGKKWGTKVETTKLKGKHLFSPKTKVWSMSITDSMKESVLYEGQPRYDIDGGNNLKTQQKIEKMAKEITSHEEFIELTKQNTKEFVDKIKENKSLQKRLHNAKRQMLLSPNPTVNPTKLGKVTKDILAEMESTIKAKDLQDRVTGIYNEYFTAIKKSKGVESKVQEANDNMMKQFADLAVDIADSSVSYVESEYYAALKSYLKDVRIKIPDYAKDEAHFAEFRKAHMGTFNLTNDGLEIDRVYQELLDLFPGAFSEDATNPADQLNEIADALERLKPYAYNPHSGAMQDAIDHIVYRFVSEADGISAMPKTKAQKIAEKGAHDKEVALEKERAEFERKLDKHKENSEKTIQALQKKIDDAKYVRYWEKRLSKEEKAQAVKEVRDKRDVANLKIQIRNIVTDMKKKLDKTEKNGGYPKELVQAAADVCSVIDFQTGRTNKDGTPTKASLKLSDLKMQYDALKNSPNYDFQSEYSEEISKKILKLHQKVENKRVIDLTKMELSELKDILSEINHNLSEASKQIGRANAKVNYDIATDIINSLKLDNKAISEIRNQLLKEMRLAKEKGKAFVINPHRIFEMIANYDRNSEWWQLYDQILRGSRNSAKFTMDATMPFDELTDGGGNEIAFYDFRTKNVKTGIKYVDGTDVEIPKSIVCELVMLWDRKQGRSHLEFGGVKIPDLKLFNKGKTSDALAAGKMTNAITQADIDRLKGMLDSYDKAWIERSRYLFNKVAKDAINETSMQLVGRELAKADNYIRIYVDSDFVKEDIGKNESDITIEGHGSLKETTPDAKNPVIVRGLHENVYEHIDFASKYYGLAIPIRNFNKVYKISIDDNGTPNSVKNALGSVFGPKIRDGVVVQSIKDLQSPRHRELGLFNKVKGSWLNATFWANIRSTLKQTTSYWTASSILGEDSLVKGLASYNAHRKQTKAEIAKYSGTLYKRAQGLSTTELGDRANRKRLAGLSSKTTKVINKYLPVLRKIPEWIRPGNWLQSMDCAVSSALWDACKFEVSKSMKKTDEGYMKAVTDMYERVIEETQSNYDVLHRPEALKSTNELYQTISMFQTDNLQQTGIMYSAYGDLRAKQKAYKADKSSVNKQNLKDAQKRMDKAIRSRIYSSMWLAAVSILGDVLLRKFKPYIDDEEKEITSKSVLEQMMLKMSDDMVGIFVPVWGSFLGDIADTFTNGYDLVSVPSFDVIEDFIKATSKISKAYDEDGDVLEAWIDAIPSISNMTGIPAKNISDLYNGIKGYISDIEAGEFAHDLEDYTSGNKSFYNYGDLASYIASGDSTKETKWLEYYSANGKEIAKGSLTKELKPAYVQMLLDSPQSAYNIKRKLVLDYAYTESTVDGWMYAEYLKHIVPDKKFDDGTVSNPEYAIEIRNTNAWDAEAASKAIKSEYKATYKEEAKEGKGMTETLALRNALLNDGVVTRADLDDWEAEADESIEKANKKSDEEKAKFID